MNDAICNIMYTCIYYHFQHQIHKQAYSMSAIDAIALRKQQPTHCRQQLSSAEIQQLPSTEKPMQREKIAVSHCMQQQDPTMCIKKNMVVLKRGQKQFKFEMIVINKAKNSLINQKANSEFGP